MVMSEKDRLLIQSDSKNESILTFDASLLGFGEDSPGVFDELPSGLSSEEKVGDGAEQGVLLLSDVLPVEALGFEDRIDLIADVGAAPSSRNRRI